MAQRLDNELFQLKWNFEDNQNRITFNVYRSETDDLCTDKTHKILATGLKSNVFSLPVENNDKAYYYYITVSDSYHNESEVSTPAFFYHSETIK